MRQSLHLGLRDRLARSGSAELLRVPGLGRQLTTARVNAVRRLASRVRWGGEGASAERLQAELLRYLVDPTPALRRAAAWGLGRSGRHEHAARLLQAADLEPQDEPRLAMAVAAVRCGAPVARGWRRVQSASRRVFDTASGPREVMGALGWGPADGPQRRWALALGAEPGWTVDRLRARARERILQDPEDIAALDALAAQQHPDDYDLIAGWAAGGRRQAHGRLRALGLHGDPRASAPLVAVLRAMYDDPGRGFRQRREAGLALGRLGDPRAFRALMRAIRDEARDHEGRPGAGMGVQLPVRGTLIYALGEAGARAAVGELIPYLSQTHGSVTGGFHLPAMDALSKLAGPDRLEPAVRGPEALACNALGVLAALGAWEVVQRSLDDPRPGVARVARAAITRRDGGPGVSEASG